MRGYYRYCVEILDEGLSSSCSKFFFLNLSLGVSTVSNRTTSYDELFLLQYFMHLSLGFSTVSN